MSFSDAIKGPLSMLLRASAPELDYLALYPAKVVTQNADLSLELAPDDARIPGQSKVLIKHGVPGMTAKVSNGARVLLGFANGNPKLPYSALWELATVTELVLNGTVLKLGAGDATQAAVHGDALKTYLDALLTGLNAFANTASTATTAPQIAAAALTLKGVLTVPPFAPAANYRSTVVKVK